MAKKKGKMMVMHGDLRAVLDLVGRKKLVAEKGKTVES